MAQAFPPAFLPGHTQRGHMIRFSSKRNGPGLLLPPITIIWLQAGSNCDRTRHQRD